MPLKVGEMNYKNGPTEIAAWAKRCGFTEQADGSYATSVGDTQIVIVLRKLGINVSATSPRGTQSLANPNFVRLEIDEIDMLNGAGLSSSFQQRYLEGTDIPWYPPELKAALDKMAAELPEVRRRGQAETMVEDHASKGMIA
jgi:hypothetical protein